MKAGTLVTDGGDRGTNTRIRPLTWGLICALILISDSVTVTSALFTPEAERHYALWEVVVTEGSSGLLLFLLPPVFFAAFAHWSHARIGIWRFIAVQVALCLAFSCLHVTGMALVRQIVFAWAHVPYDFTHGRPLLVFVYELRKDVVTYLIFLLFFWLDQKSRLRTPQFVPVERPERLEVRSDGRILYLRPEEIACIDAAGNYVELHLRGRSLLVRGTLNAFEARLRSHGFVRAHRSRIVNARHIGSIRTAPSGDMEITLDDGRALTASRRYREKIIACQRECGARRTEA